MTNYEVMNAIREALVGDNAISAIVGSRIYYIQAPLDATLPYVVFLLQAETEDNDTALRSRDAIYSVRGVSDDALEAQNIAQAIEDELHERAFAPFADEAIYRCQKQSTITYLERAARARFWHCGGLYRVRISGGGDPYWGDNVNGGGLPIVLVSASRAITTLDYVLVATNPITLTLPSAVGIDGRIYTIKSDAVGSVVLATVNGETIDGETSQQIDTQYTSMTVISNGTDWLII